MNCFPIVFGAKKYSVNPELFSTFSDGFQKVFRSESAHNSQITINGPFNDESIYLFTRLCQGENVHVEDSMMKEMTCLAKIFECSSIYNSALNYIRSNIDPGFIPADSVGSIIYGPIPNNNNNSCSRHSLEGLQFDDDDDEKPMDTSETTSSDKNVKTKITKNYFLENPMILEVRKEKRFLKSTRFFLYEKGEVIASAKYQHTGVVINKGLDVHFGAIETCAAKVLQLNFKNKIIIANDQKITLKYFDDKTGNRTMSLIYLINGETLKLSGASRDPNAAKGGKLLKSQKVLSHCKQCILTDPSGKGALTMRKTSKKTYQIQSSIQMSNLLAFSILISATIGPHSSNIQDEPKKA